MTTRERNEKAATNSAILLWQTRFRLMLIIAVGGITLGLNWMEALSIDSVVANRYGADTAVTWFVGITFTYFIFVTLMSMFLRARGAVGGWAIAATLIADALTFNGAMLVATPPEWYERAIILSMFSLQLALLYSGWRVAMWSLLFTAGAYTGMLFTADWLGGDLAWTRAWWTLAVFTLGSTAFVMLHADLSARMSMIVRVFDRAREGVFSLSFDETSGLEPDGITVVGTGYDKMRKQLTSLILTDPLTECFNPRGFEQFCAREIARAARRDVGVAMLAIDLDHFKSINDTFGHVAGDEVLRGVGEVLRQTARLSDVVARVGGEEFAILAADTDEAGAVRCAERLLEACAAHKFALRGDRKVTFSIGVAFAQARTDNVAQVLRGRADAALYAAKAAGRNQLVVWKEPAAVVQSA
jgi:diguanylate cyclase (GGDEF)-like protein